MAVFYFASTVHRPSELLALRFPFVCQQHHSFDRQPFYISPTFTTSIMQTEPSAIHNNNLSIDVRICGNIPRNEMHFGNGAPSDWNTLTSRQPALNASGLAETNGSPTLRKISICDAGKKVLSDLIFQRSEAMMKSDTGGQVLQHVIPYELKIPPWAVAAQGESFLEVRQML